MTRIPMALRVFTWELFLAKKLGSFNLQRSIIISFGVFTCGGPFGKVIFSYITAEFVADDILIKDVCWKPQIYDLRETTIGKNRLRVLVLAYAWNIAWK